jgi:DnaJ-class molecular chaperone
MTGPVAPGDQAPEGTPGTGENLCPICNGRGNVEGEPCVNCDGSGVVVEGIGGG